MRGKKRRKGRAEDRCHTVHGLSAGLLRHCLGERCGNSIEKDIAKLADILGHSSIDTTRIYIMTTGTEHRRKIERLGLVI